MAIDAPKRMALDVQASNDLRQQMQQDPKAGIQKAAKDFEAMFLNIVLKSMRDTVPQDGMFDSEQTRFFTTMLDQQMAQDLASKGTLGFARMLQEQFNRTQAAQLPTDGQTTGTGTTAGAASGLSPAAQSLLQSLQQLKQTTPTTLPGNVVVPPAAGAGVGSVSGLGVDAISGQGSGAAAIGNTGNPADFVNKVWPHAVEASRTTGIPPQFLVAHAALETGWGRSEMKRQDGQPAHNLFGIKAGRSWTGERVNAETTEFVNGQETRSVETFRAYGSYSEAFRDYASLLRNNPRFSAVIGSQDGTEFARRLQQAGYATDPQYADKLARIINGPTLRQAMIG